MSRSEDVRKSSGNPVVERGLRQLEGKLAIITGASRGIGSAVASNLASKGCHLILNYTSQSSLSQTEKLAESLEQEHNVNTHIVRADLGSQSGPAHIVKMANIHFAHPKTGKLQIDIIIKQCGDCTVEDFSWHYNINVRGPLLLTQAALPYLPTDRSGRIVNISSVSSSLGFVGQSVYGGTKAALEAMTRTWARELSERATVNAVIPGPVATDMHHDSSPEWIAMLKPFSQNTPLQRAREGVDSKEVCEMAKEAGGRDAYGSEIAGIVGMLCSPESGWCTGSVVCANGGMKFSV